MTIGVALSRAAEYLTGKGVESPRLDAELLFSKALGLSRVQLYTEHDRPLTSAELSACRELLARRGRREPLAYVLGEWGFRRLTLRVDRRALVPRPETEVVVERCLALLDGLEAPVVLDVGVGSGAIALAIADERPGARVTAIDASADALALARENAAATGLADRVSLAEHDAKAGLPAGPYDLVVANPPYVAEREIEELPPEVRDWEPRDALVEGGHASAVARGACSVLRAGGWLVLETHEYGARAVAAELESLGYGDVAISRDLAARERLVEGRWPK